MSRLALVAFAASVLAFGAAAQDAVPDVPPLDPAAAGPADRIWSANPDDPDLWLRRAFALPAGVDTARLVFTCDNECRVLVNGKQVAAADSWMDITVVDLEQLTRDNVVTVAAKNTGGPGAFAAWLLWTDAKGDHQELVSDATWKVTTNAADAAPGWESLDFDDSGWAAATANFTSEFGKNLYNGAPTQVHFRNRHSKNADAIAVGLERLRRATSRDAARKALDAIERAVMEMRTQLWREEQAEQQARQETTKPRDGGR